MPCDEGCQRRHRDHWRLLSREARLHVSLTAMLWKGSRFETHTERLLQLMMQVAVEVVCGA